MLQIGKNERPISDQALVLHSGAAAAQRPVQRRGRDFDRLHPLRETGVGRREQEGRVDSNGYEFSEDSHGVRQDDDA